MTTAKKNDDSPTEFAEGVQIPQLANPAQAAALANSPTEEDYAKEWGTYRATGVCRVGRTVAATAGQALPASHPDLKRWLADGTAEKVGK